MKGNEHRLRDLWVNNKKIHQHIHILGVSRRIEKGSEKIFEDTVAENFPNMRRETVTEVQDVWRIPYRVNPRRNTLKHKLRKIKDKEKNIKSNKGKATYNILGNSH